MNTRPDVIKKHTDLQEWGVLLF